MIYDDDDNDTDDNDDDDKLLTAGVLPYVLFISNLRQVSSRILNLSRAWIQALLNKVCNSDNYYIPTPSSNKLLPRGDMFCGSIYGITRQIKT